MLINFLLFVLTSHTMRCRRNRQAAQVAARSHSPYSSRQKQDDSSRVDVRRGRVVHELQQGRHSSHSNNSTAPKAEKNLPVLPSSGSALWRATASSHHG